MWDKQKVKKQNLKISQKYFVQEVEMGSIDYFYFNFYSLSITCKYKMKYNHTDPHNLPKIPLLSLICLFIFLHFCLFIYLLMNNPIATTSVAHMCIN